MDSEIKIALITIILTAFMNLVIFLFQKWLNKRRNTVDINLDEAEIAKTDSETIQTYVDTLREVQSLYEEQRLANIKRDVEIKRLSGLVEDLTEKNQTLTLESEKMKMAIAKLTKENTTMEGIIISGQKANQRLRDSIRKLIQQMKDAGIKPAFTLKEEE